MENYFIERKPDSDVLVIAFTGYYQWLMMKPFEFFEVTKASNCNRILLKDPSKRLYLGGIGGELNSFDKLLNRLRSDIATISPTVITIIGTSAGGFGALLFGHLLKANYVHAFSPPTFTNISTGIKYRQWRKLKEYYREFFNFYRLPIKIWKYFDLKDVLSHYNGVTEYTIYVCEHFKADVVLAEHLRVCPNVTITKKPCNNHNVIREMLKERNFFDILKKHINHDTFELSWSKQVQAALYQIAEAIPKGEKVIIVDEDTWQVNADNFPGYKRLHFLERQQQYWGLPEDDRAAIAELNRLHQEQDVRFIAFGWPSFWWFEHYTAFNTYLRQNHKCIVETNTLVLFELDNRNN